jgi:CBS domain-containing protein
MLLKDVCVLDVACCVRSTRIVEAARLMRKFHIGDLIVVDDPEEDRVPAGILTDRDIVVEVLGKGLDPMKTTAGEVMRSQLVIARDDEDTAVAVERMHQHGVRRIPVVNRHGGLIGVFTLDDALRLHAARAKALAEIVDKEHTREQRTRR